uniref:Obscurin-like protein 1 n=2 Tax=Petromyzon marinus TaxID=7757 RepID=A0AAJ7WLU6_PETMA|nr:obscurin-like protein 1 [Petromyzon marinus]
MASTFGGAPRFLSRPRAPRGLVLGADATINCKIAGEPAPVVLWEKGGERLGAGGRYRPYEDGDGGYGLVISEVRGDDSGLYTCRASNGVGEAYMAVTLSVPAAEGPPGVTPSIRTPPPTRTPPTTETPPTTRTPPTTETPPTTRTPPPSRTPPRTRTPPTTQTPPPRTLPTQSRPTSTSAPTPSHAPSRTRPAFESAPRSVRVRAGRDAAFSCRASGQPRPRVSWEKGGRAIDHDADGGGRYAVSESATSDAACTASVLRVYCARAAVDAAEIVCRAANAAGEVTVMVRLEVDEEEVADDVEEKGSRHSRREPSRSQGSSAYPHANGERKSGGYEERIGGGDGGDDDDDHEWRKQKEEEEYFSPRLLEAKRRMEGLGLELKKLRDGSACGQDDLISSAHRHHKQQQQQHHRHRRHQRHHEQQQQEQPPVKPMSYTISEGKHAKFSCNVTGKPRPRIVWKKEGRELGEGRRHLLYESDEGLFVLKVLYCRARDQGLYTCEASNRVGFTYSAVQLHVREPPCPFRSRLRDMEAREGGVATLECEVARAGDEAAWFLEERRLGHSEKHAVESSGKLRRLVVRDLGPDDDGVYVCETADGSRTVAELSVTGKIAKRLPRRVKVAAGGGAVLEAEVARSGGQVHWLWAGREVRPEAHGEGDDPRARAAMDGAKRHTLTLHALELRDSGPVVFVADGSRSTAQLLVVGADRLGSGGSMLPTLGELTDTSVTVRWTPLPDARGYAVERNALGRPEWLRCHAEELLTEPWLRVRVPESAEYRFRVFALRAGALPGSCEAVPGTATLAVEPVVLRAPHDLRVSEGQDAEFRVVPGGRYETRTEGHARLLVIRDVDAGDSGAQVEFRCGEECGRAATLTVTAAPDLFVRDPEPSTDVRAESGSPAVLACRVRRPGSRVRWLGPGGIDLLVDKRPPPPSRGHGHQETGAGEGSGGARRKEGEEEGEEQGEVEFSERSEGTLRELTVRRARPGHSGQYTCATSGDSLTFRLSVAEPPATFVSREETLTSVEAVEGERAELSCVVSRGDASVAWLKEGRTLSEQQQQELGLRLEASGTLRRLVIDRAQAAHAGVYTCDTGHERVDFTVRVTEPPATFVSREETLTSVEAVEGEEGRTLSEQQQQELGLRLEASGTLRRLVIDRAQAAHAGVYTCDTGHERVDFTVRVTEPPATFVSREETLTSVEAVEGERAELSCVVSRGDASVAWLKEGRTLSEQQQQELGLRLEASGTLRRLVIDRAQAAHAGVYTCDTGHERVDFTVRVTEPPARFVSREETLTDVEAVEGEDVALGCEVSRDDAAVSWQRAGGEELSDDERRERLSDGVERALVLHGCEAADAGTYVCVTRDGDAIEFHVRVTVTHRTRSRSSSDIYSPPKFSSAVATPPPCPTAPPALFTQPLRDVYARAGEPVALGCLVSDPRAHVTWLRDGLPLGEGGEEEEEEGERWEEVVAEEGVRRELRIARVALEHEGEYTCETSGDVTSAWLAVEVPRPVEFVSELHGLTVLEGEDATFRCSVLPADAAVRWELRGAALEAGGRASLHEDGAARSLLLRAVTALDAGEVAALADGAETRALLRVQEAPVSFVRGLEATAAEEGDDVVFTVELSRAQAEVRWARNGVLLNPGAERAELRVHGPLRSLTVRSVSFSDRGVYSCESLHERTQARLSVEPRQVRLVQAPSAVEATERGTATFSLRLSHADVPGQWFRDAVPVSPGPLCRVAACGTEHSLTLAALSLDDSGLVSFQAEGVHCSARLTVREPPVRFVRELEETRAPEKSRVTLECEVSREFADVKWYKDGEEVKPGGRCRLMSQGPRRSLLVPRCERADSGIYACVVTGDTRTEAALRVHARDVRMVQRLTECDVEEGQAASFECETTHDEVSAVWTLNGTRLKPGDNVRIRDEGTRHSLVLGCVRAEDAGEVGFSAEGAECTTRLRVRELPVRITKPLRDKIAIVGRRAVLECRVSRATTRVSWQHGGRELAAGERYQMGAQGEYRTLVIVEAAFSDEGSYTCRAGEASSSARLLVEDQVLQVTRELQDVRVPSSGTAVFEVELSGPAARPPRWALNGTRLRDGSGGAHMEARGTVYRLSLFELRASMSGLVEFSAGEAKSSARLTVA